jgi:4-aminobutyrate aminotransferase
VAAVIEHCRRESNVLLMNAGTYGSVIRFMPALVVDEAEINVVVDALRAALAATA